MRCVSGCTARETSGEPAPVKKEAKLPRQLVEVQSDLRSSHKCVGILYQKYPHTYVIYHKYVKSISSRGMGHYLSEHFTKTRNENPMNKYALKFLNFFSCLLSISCNERRRGRP